MLDVDLGLAGHKLKSPLVSINALLFILKKEINEKDKKAIKRITEIESKTEILNKRINQFILFLEYEKEKVGFLYELFDISEIITFLKRKNNNLKIKTINQPVVADKEKIEFALSAFLESFIKVNKINVAKENKKIEFRISGEVNTETLDSKKIFNEKDDKALNLFIAKKIIELHKGKVKIDKKLVIINIPLKPASKK
jgi:signal transduction histidine kinase